jgi:hypothetical protein
MFAIDSFIEIQVIGALLLLGASPFLLLIVPTFSRQQGAFAFLRRLNDKGAIAVLIVIAAFCVGIAGNRIIDDLLGASAYEGEELHTPAYSAIVNGTSCPKSIKLAEFQVPRDNEYARGWLERHKSFMRVLRGAFSACLLFFVCMLAYRVGQWRRPGLLKPRYSVGHFAVTLLLFTFFFVAYVSESTHYYKRVCELATGLPGCDPSAGTIPSCLLPVEAGGGASK